MIPHHRVPETPYTDADIDAAVTAISDPARLRQAQDVVGRAAPALQQVLAAALQDGGWFDAAHQQAVREAAGAPDGEPRIRAVQTLLAEETRLGMLVGVAIGFELARELDAVPAASSDSDQPTEDPTDA
jgi:hypothetical protein